MYRLVLESSRQIVQKLIVSNAYGIEREHNRPTLFYEVSNIWFEKQWKGELRKEDSFSILL